MNRPRVLVVDDSAFARTVLARLLRASGQIDVVGTARDGNDALEQIAARDPDIVTLDLTMPELDGLEVLRRLRGRARPRVIVVSISTVENEIGAEALALGAVDLITKPTALADDRLHELGDELVAKVLAIAGPAPLARVPPPFSAPQVQPRAQPAGKAELVVVGTSTGGPQALTRLLAALPATLAAPVAMVLHIPVGYTGPLAQRLNKSSALEVLEAEDGLALRPGRAILAQAGMHLRVARVHGQLVAQLTTSPGRQFMPSVDELFESAAAVVGQTTLGVILTGMGDDGLLGSQAIASVGGALLTESESSCVVYGMPRCVHEAGIGAVAAPLDRMAGEIAKRV
ncbi:MAG TPA: chemotaxis-specific protein-glutamate methyltransferase CheB [Kofleriaceae bacterium]|nr:chemotaxis-specific protein-glutamate methyltransferase CheB [Kofleriaceae bacterium]